MGSLQRYFIRSNHIFKVAHRIDLFHAIEKNEVLSFFVLMSFSSKENNRLLLRPILIPRGMVEGKEKNKQVNHFYHYHFYSETTRLSF